MQICPRMKKVVRVAPKTPWGIALEKLREAAERRDNVELTQYRLCKEAGIEHSTYRHMLKTIGKKGPGLLTIQNLLDKMKWTWRDFIDHYDPTLAEPASQVRAAGSPAPKGGRRNPYVEKPRKVG